MTLRSWGEFMLNKTRGDAHGERRQDSPFAALPATSAESAEYFKASWEAYQCSNPRLRDPRVLPALCRRGVPDELRSAVWTHCLGIDAPPGGGELGNGHLVLGDAEMPVGAAQLIETDVNRTFQTCVEFQQGGGQAKLRRVLRSLAAADHGIGYCQSLNFVAAMLLMVLGDERVVVLAARQIVVKLGTRAWYSDGMRQLRADALVLEEFVLDRLPGVHRAFRAQKFEFVFVCSKWFLALFTTALEGETLRRVWDVIMCDGIEAVFRIAFALIHRHSDTASCADSLDDLVMLFQGRQLDWTAEDLIDMAYSTEITGPLTRTELAQRRHNALTRVSSADSKLEIRDACLWRGGVHPPSFPKR
eukprot:TRINITY_DN73620_c0_g1_i1.p1 TRINITY_DN73620_c0_g1~~TRINITY_DN73620_c0_g1_i1.p1  ORF type:complete len:360 (+),score=58.46 TRINITY_DN73620_c0_g1_i1:39-1118(+)